MTSTNIQYYNDYEKTPALGRATNTPLLVRKEVFHKDHINAKNYEHWQTDSKTGIYDRIDKNSVPAYMDVAPGTSRTNNKDYRGAPLYNVPGNSAAYTSSYFQGFDVKTDPTNLVRELRSAVFEIKGDRGALESEKLNKRLTMNRITS